MAFQTKLLTVLSNFPSLVNGDLISTELGLYANLVGNANLLTWCDICHLHVIYHNYICIYMEKGKERNRQDDCINMHNLSKLQITYCEKNLFFGIYCSFVENFKTVKSFHMLYSSCSQVKLHTNWFQYIVTILIPSTKIKFYSFHYLLQDTIKYSINPEFEKMFFASSYPSTAWSIFLARASNNDGTELVLCCWDKIPEINS